MADIRANPEQDQEHEGASTKELLIEACRRNNVDLLQEVISGCKSDEEISGLLNNTTTVLGNHLYHEAALRGNYEVIDLLLDQPNFECDPVNRAEGDTPLHSAVRFLNSEPSTPEARAFGLELVGMMLEAGSNPRVRNKARLTPFALVDPANTELRDLIQKAEYAMLNRGDFVDAGDVSVAKSEVQQQQEDEDAEFSGSDEEEREEFERRKKERLAGRR